MRTASPPTTVADKTPTLQSRRHSPGQHAQANCKNSSATARGTHSGVRPLNSVDHNLIKYLLQYHHGTAPEAERSCLDRSELLWWQNIRQRQRERSRIWERIRTRWDPGVHTEAIKAPLMGFSLTLLLQRRLVTSPFIYCNLVIGTPSVLNSNLTTLQKQQVKVFQYHIRFCEVSGTENRKDHVSMWNISSSFVFTTVR